MPYKLQCLQLGLEVVTNISNDDHKGMVLIFLVCCDFSTEFADYAITKKNICYCCQFGNESFQGSEKNVYLFIILKTTLLVTAQSIET